MRAQTPPRALRNIWTISNNKNCRLIDLSEVFDNCRGLFYEYLFINIQFKVYQYCTTVCRFSFFYNASTYTLKKIDNFDFRFDNFLIWPKKFRFDNFVHRIENQNCQFANFIVILDVFSNFSRLSKRKSNCRLIREPIMKSLSFLGNRQSKFSKWQFNFFDFF